MGAELFIPRRRADPAADESIGGFITRRFGAEATTYLAEPLLAGIHAGDVDRLSLRALFPRFAEAEQRDGSLIRAFRRQRAGPAADGAFKSLPDGLSELVRALVARLPTGSVQTSTEVVRLTSSASGRGYAVTTSAGTMHEGRTIVLTTPAYVTATLLHDRDAELARDCAEIPYASIATVALAFPRTRVDHPLNGSGYVVPRIEDNGILAVSWLSSKWPYRAPADWVLMRAFVGGTRDPGALEQSDAALVSRCVAAIAPVLGVHGDPQFSRVYRFRRASAQHEVGHLERLKGIEQRLAAHPGLFVTGSGFRGVGIPDCIADARATAAQVSAWLTRTAPGIVANEQTLR
jgi:oxygen-dependent protoporphyrinogen oxidase